MFDRIRKSRDEGFTLIELLIVVIILGILAAIVVFAVGSTRKDAVSSSCRTSTRSIQLAAEAYYTKNNVYPNTGPELLASANQGGVLQAWPSAKDYTLTWNSGGSSYSVTLAQANNSGIAGGTITPATTDGQVDTACTKP